MLAGVDGQRCLLRNRGTRCSLEMRLKMSIHPMVEVFSPTARMNDQSYKYEWYQANKGMGMNIANIVQYHTSLQLLITPQGRWASGRGTSDYTYQPVTVRYVGACQLPLGG